MRARAERAEDSGISARDRRLAFTRSASSRGRRWRHIVTFDSSHGWPISLALARSDTAPGSRHLARCAGRTPPNQVAAFRSQRKDGRGKSSERQHA